MARPEKAGGWQSATSRQSRHPQMEMRRGPKLQRFGLAGKLGLA